MKKAREYIAEGLGQRAEAGIKVRQPLKQVKLPLLPDGFKDIIADELNVKAVEFGGKKVDLDTKLTDELKSEGIMRELVRVIQNARKNAGLQVDDRIKLKIESDSPEITAAAKNFKDTIYAETLATGELTGEGASSESVKIDAQEVSISLVKA